jgi:hypothetical protein
MAKIDIEITDTIEIGMAKYRDAKALHMTWYYDNTIRNDEPLDGPNNRTIVEMRKYADKLFIDALTIIGGDIAKQLRDRL